MRIKTALTLLALCSACSDHPAVVSTPVGPAPDSFRVSFETSRGNFIVQVNRAWAPKGADRFYQLVSDNFFDDNYFFRVLPAYIAQFGLSNNPKANNLWDPQRIADDPLVHPNTHGTLSFANEGAASRSHQLFFNLKDNPSLDKLNFVPIGQVTSGIAVMDSLYDGYGDDPKQVGIRARGKGYLALFPKLDYMRRVMVIK